MQIGTKNDLGIYFYLLKLWNSEVIFYRLAFYFVSNYQLNFVRLKKKPLLLISRNIIRETFNLRLMLLALLEIRHML